MTTIELAVTGVGAAGWLLFLLAGAAAVSRSGRPRRDAEAAAHELSRRSEQLRLLSRISLLLAQEASRGGIARITTEFFVREMGAGRALFWEPDAQGEPQAPERPSQDCGGGAAALLPEAQRIILARAAARGTVPLILRGDAQDQRPQPLGPADAPAHDFALYIPLAGSSREGVLEVYGGQRPWGSDHWELIGALTAHFTCALRRARHYEEMRERADVDFVTGLFNHRFMQVYLERLVGSEAAPDRRFAVLLMDVDNFKAFNDTYGHSIGDRVLQVIADQLKLMTDKVGTVGRFGGDEFIVVLPGHTRQEAGAFAQAFQDWLTTYAFQTPAGRRLPIVLSWGLAAFPEDSRRRQELLAAADARLYQSKRADRQPPDSNGGGKQSLGTFGLLDGLLASVDSRDNYTRAHCEATAEYALALGEEIGLSPPAQRTLRLAALLHDVGKICIPDHILGKRGQLSPEEFAVIRHHVSIAENLIVDVPNAEEVRQIVRHHHERFDGSGYPDGLRGEAIPLLARVLALADAFSAMTLDRPHRKGLRRDQACAELRRVAGAQLDPALVEAFGRLLAAPQHESAAMAAAV